MNQKDLKQIKEVIDDSVTSSYKKFKTELREELMLDFGEFIEENINPQFKKIDERFDKLENRIDKLGDSRHQDRGNLNSRINKLSRILHRKKILTKIELEQLEQVK